MMFTGADLKKCILIGLVFSIPAIFPYNQASAAENSDAIAVRVIPNVEHYSIDQWYKQQGYKGSPQKMIVDGYEAIRDGRTVFVNAANVENNKIYTNIYLISYNQDSADNTLDILGQLVSHWKFNSNLGTKGLCSVSKIACQSDADCPNSYACSTGSVDIKNGTNLSNKGKCVPREGKICLGDSECPADIFCDSLKAKVTRDVKRLANLNEIRKSLDLSKGINGSYPILNSGTYIPGSSISTWPSWTQGLGAKLAGSNLYIDPINSLGDCPGFEAATCWKKDSNSDSAGFYKVGGDQKPILPLGSYAYIYSVKNNGTAYDLCATFETKGYYDTASGKINSQSCAGPDHYDIPSNSAPTIKSSFLQGNSGQEFNGYVQAIDAENDAISWSINLNNTNFSSWNSLPVLQDSGELNKKTIYSSRAGGSGNYPISLTLSDNRGAVATYPLSLVISNSRPMIEADDTQYIADPINPFNYSFFIQAPQQIASYSVRLKSGLPDILAGGQGNRSILSPTRWRIDYSLLIPTTTKVTQDREIIYTITVTDKANASISKDIKISLKAVKPTLEFDCDTNARVNRPYPLNGTPCSIGDIKQGNHTISYSLSSFPALILQISNQKTFLSGTTTAATASGSPITITATNEYGATSTKSFILKVNTYCGDGILQTPNTEGRGGAGNNGMESCDGEAGVTKQVSLSPLVQYGCKTKTPSDTYPILDGSHCVFEEPDNGGGYCGDGLCQFMVGGINIENTTNCPVDCGNPSCGNGVIEGSEECDGAAGSPKTCHDVNSNYDSTATVTCSSNCKWDTSNCLVCGPGQRVSGASCVPCTAGYYKKGTNNETKCLPCAIGTYSAVTGASSCTPCGAGEYNQTQAATSCQACKPGTYGTGNNTCYTCPADSFCTGGHENTSCSSYFGSSLHSLAGSDSSKDCVPINCNGGYYYNSDYHTCSQCPSGTFSQAGAGECDKCLPGTYLPVGVGGSSSCNQCIANYYCIGGNNITHCDGSKISSPGSSSSDDCH